MGGLNIYQRIVLIIGCIVLIAIIYMTFKETLTKINPHEFTERVETQTSEGVRTEIGEPYKYVHKRKVIVGADAAFLLLKYDYKITIVRCSLITLFIFALYIAFKSRKSD